MAKSLANEEVLFSAYDKGWGCDLPTTLITFEDGAMDLHLQTGAEFKVRLKRAQEVLKERGLKTVNPKPDFIGPTGAYFTLTKEVNDAQSKT